ncbi:hypothetical protein [Streptomyces sp. NPDC058683]|uniref:hypothetical protein n=1 Tax=Streptomyces sp. NPDC058683 TaxID=3346597 RepID=UPI00364E46A1
MCRAEVGHRSRTECLAVFPERSRAIQHVVPDFSRLHSVERLVTDSSERPRAEGAEHALEAGAHLFLFLTDISTIFP